MKCEVMWRKDMPAEIRKSVEPLFKKWQHVIPAWCRHLSIAYFEIEETGVVASVSVDREYLQARLRIHPGYLTESPANRERTIVHELIHLGTEPWANWNASIIDNLTDDEGIKKHLTEELRHMRESVVQDVTFMLVPPK
jgi:hypothetical protein